MQALAQRQAWVQQPYGDGWASLRSGSRSGLGLAPGQSLGILGSCFRRSASVSGSFAEIRVSVSVHVSKDEVR